MEYIYSAMLLNSAGAEIDAKSVTKVLKAAGLKTDKGRAEALVAALEGVDIEEAMATAAVAAPAAAARSSSGRRTRLQPTLPQHLPPLPAAAAAH